jgi:hypothetical protein
MLIVVTLILSLHVIFFIVNGWHPLGNRFSNFDTLTGPLDPLPYILIPLLAFSYSSVLNGFLEIVCKIPASHLRYPVFVWFPGGPFPIGSVLVVFVEGCGHSMSPFIEDLCFDN